MHVVWFFIKLSLCLLVFTIFFHLLNLYLANQVSIYQKSLAAYNYDVLKLNLVYASLARALGKAYMEKACKREEVRKDIAYQIISLLCLLIFLAHSKF